MEANWQFSLTYLFDIVIFLHTPDEHMDHARQFLTLLYEAAVTMNLKKCELFKSFIDYLGHFIHPGRLEFPTLTIDP